MEPRRTNGAASSARSRAPRKPDAPRRQILQQLATRSTDIVLSVEGDAIALTHLDRVYWPGDDVLGQPAITKRDFIRYLTCMSTRMLPHMADRPLTLFRWPGGINARRMLMKHWEGGVPSFVQRVRIFSEAKGHADEYLLCNNLATLIWLAQNGTLELHVWHSRVVGGRDTPITSTAFSTSKLELEASVVEYPDYIVFDVDPYIYAGIEVRGSEPVLNAPAFDKARHVAFWLKTLLEHMRLTSFVKTSGKTGLHVVVPIRRTLRFAAVRDIARTIAEHLLREHRESITTEWSTDKRTGKVFLDYNMNVRGKSLIAPYCPRGLPGAPVSMPLSWSALKAAYPMDFRIPTLGAQASGTRGSWDEMPRRKPDLGKLLGQ